MMCCTNSDYDLNLGWNSSLTRFPPSQTPVEFLHFLAEGQRIFVL